jgi:hypothetical protein
VAVYAETCCVVLFQKEPCPVIIQNFWFKKHKRDNIPEMSGIHVLGLFFFFFFFFIIIIIIIIIIS